MDRVRRRRLAGFVGILAGSGMLFSGPGTSCTSFAMESALSVADFCFIFDCQNGLFGGTFDPCGGIGSGNQTIEGQNRPQFFTDCPTGP